RLPDVHHRFAHLQGEGELRVGEDLRRILVSEDRVVVEDLLGEVHDGLGAAGGELDRGGLVVTEDDVAEHRGGGVVHVHGRAFGADEGAHGAFDEVTSGLGEHGDDDVIGNGVVVDDGTHEVEIGLRRGGETD